MSLSLANAKMTPESKAEYAKDEAPVIAKITCHINELREHSFVQNCSLKKAKNALGERALSAAFKDRIRPSRR